MEIRFDASTHTGYISRDQYTDGPVKQYSSGIRHDYKSGPLPSQSRSTRHWSWFVVGLALPLLTLSLMLVSERNESKIPAPAELTELTMQAQRRPLPADPPTAAPVAPKADPAIDAGLSLELLVRPGDSLDSLFRRHDLSLADLGAMSRLDEAGQHLRLLRPGDNIKVTRRGAEVLTLSREIDETQLLEISRSNGGFAATIVSRPFEARIVRAHGVIRSSLFEAGVEAGISDATTMNMAGIFQWDIDFLQDVRIGDEFTVIYEELWRDGLKLRDGSIVAAEFANRGQVYRAARYTDPAGHSDFYTPEGRSVRKAFVRAPVDFTRISSNFDPNRRHPVLNSIRAHRGVDYAAPTGTPVKAAGDGKVEFRGSKSGYGNTIILQHGGNISTLYAHLSKFAKPKAGSRVKQGDVIGYVGKSGLATGPHLHYEYRLNGVHRNPRTVALPPADPVPPTQLQSFQASVGPLWRQLDLYERVRLATAAN
jgi:murein DD-endopeptidase MepM/ murein hydrolase activator NlpD